jgi:hypothetical protein
MRNQYIRTVSDGRGENSAFGQISSLFSREPDSDFGAGSHYIMDLVGVGGAKLVSVVCLNHDIPVVDMRNNRSHALRPIREIVKSILEATPPRCAILLNTRENEQLGQKIRTRIMNMMCDLRYRRVIFCLTDQETGSTNSIQVPGTTEDKMQMILYHVPEQMQSLPGFTVDCLRQLAEAMDDCVLFEPRVWSRVTVDKSISEFLSTALYQVVRRVRSDPGIDTGAFPSFERDWRRGIASQLQRRLIPSPDALCPGIHRVIPIGVSSSDAIQAMEVAIPKNIQDPYAITVQSSAVDDQCGSIAITQPMRYTVVNVNCIINPGILVDVCRELRTGHKAVVAEVHTLNQKLSKMEDTQAELKDQLCVIVQRLPVTHVGPVVVEEDKELATCTKPRCRRIVTKRFRSGKLHRQCTACVLNK